MTSPRLSTLGTQYHWFACYVEALINQREVWLIKTHQPCKVGRPRSI